MRWCVYLDMDAFYVSCELKRRPELRGRPVAVSADPKGGKGRGVVLSASYEARGFGLRSALPVSQAFALCPDYVWIPPDFSFYEENSRRVMGLLKARSPEARTFSIDEAAYPWEGGSPEAAEAEGRALQRQVRERSDLPCSIGIAPSLTLAKIASDRAKPGGVVVVAPERVASFLAPLPVRSVPGIGKVTEAALGDVGVTTLAELAAAPVERLRRALGGTAGTLRDLARGLVREEPWPEEEGPRSIGAMSTFDEDRSDPEEIREALRRLSGGLAESAARQGRWFRTVTVRVRLGDFRQWQRSRTLPQRTDSAEVLGRTAEQLAEQILGEVEARRRGRLGALSEEGPPAPALARGWRVRTLGVSVSDLSEAIPGQRRLDLFGEDPLEQRAREGPA